MKTKTLLSILISLVCLPIAKGQVAMLKGSAGLWFFGSNYVTAADAGLEVKLYKKISAQVSISVSGYNNSDNYIVKEKTVLALQSRYYSRNEHWTDRLSWASSRRGSRRTTWKDRMKRGQTPPLLTGFKRTPARAASASSPGIIFRSSNGLALICTWAAWPN